jgi:hypothetical protein
MKNIFEDLIQTIERNAVNNHATITNVKLWADSWRYEMQTEQKLNIDGVMQALTDKISKQAHDYADANDEYYLSKKGAQIKAFKEGACFAVAFLKAAVASGAVGTVAEGEVCEQCFGLGRVKDDDYTNETIPCETCGRSSEAQP